MDSLTKRGIIAVIVFFLIICTTAVVSFFIGRANYRLNDAIRRESGAAATVNRELADEQQRAAEFNQQAIRQLEEIRGITEETNRSLQELGKLNRGSSNISAQIREEANLLAYYFRSVSGILSDGPDPMGSN